MRHFQIFFLLSAMLLFWACHTTKPKISEEPECDTHGVLVDMTGLDGCGWLILTDDGRKLLPVNWPEGMPKQQNMELMFHYREKPDAASVCMAEDMIVDLDCIQPIQEKPAKPKCYDIVNPMEVPWMRMAMVKNDTRTVEKYPYLDKYAYLFKGSNLQNDLYDCQGNLLCSYREVEQNDCSDRLVQLGQGAIIWSAKE